MVAMAITNLKEFQFKVLAKSSKGKIDSGLLKGVAFMDNRKAISELQKIFHYNGIAKYMLILRA